MHHVALFEQFARTYYATLATTFSQPVKGGLHNAKQHVFLKTTNRTYVLLSVYSQIIPKAELTLSPLPQVRSGA